MDNRRLETVVNARQNLQARTAEITYRFTMSEGGTRVTEAHIPLRHSAGKTLPAPGVPVAVWWYAQREAVLL